MTKREIMQMVLETFESLRRSGLDLIAVNDNIAALKADVLTNYANAALDALAQPADATALQAIKDKWYQRGILGFQDAVNEAVKMEREECAKLTDGMQKQINADRDQALRWKRGHERYEKLRNMTTRQFAELWGRHLKGDMRFDDMVDAL